MKERPILFSGPMVRAILAGTKTQTRRVVKHQGDMEFDPRDPHYGPYWLAYAAGDLDGEDAKVRCPYGVPGDREWRTGHITAPGWYCVRGLLDESIGGDTRAVWVNPEWFTWGFDQNDDPESIGLDTNITPENVQWKRPGNRLWVRETWAYERDGTRCPDDTGILYRATDPGWDDEETGLRWRPSIFMPRWASRILLEITEVRVERLQEISAADCWAEGIESAGWDCERYGSVVECYRDLWESISGAGTWAANPWVWVVSFKRLQP
jgi:hypothetical protein